MFTSEQIQFIESLIDKRLLSAKTQLFSTGKNYHTTNDIRRVFINNLQDFSKFVGLQAFTLDVIRMFLRTKIELLPGDEELNPSDHTLTRFDRQVANALCPDTWAESPLRKAKNGRRGHYELETSWYSFGPFNTNAPTT